MTVTVCNLLCEALLSSSRRHSISAEQESCISPGAIIDADELALRPSSPNSTPSSPKVYGDDEAYVYDFCDLLSPSSSASLPGQPVLQANDGEPIHAPHQLLCSRSAYFATALSSRWTPSYSERVLDVQHVAKPAAEALARYLLTGTVALPLQTDSSIATLADETLLPELAAAAGHCIAISLPSATVKELLSTARHARHAGLRECATALVLRRLGDIVRDVDEKEKDQEDQPSSTLSDVFEVLYFFVRQDCNRNYSFDKNQSTALCALQHKASEKRLQLDFDKLVSDQAAKKDGRLGVTEQWYTADTDDTPLVVVKEGGRAELDGGSHSVVIVFDSATCELRRGQALCFYSCAHPKGHNEIQKEEEQGELIRELVSIPDYIILEATRRLQVRVKRNEGTNVTPSSSTSDDEVDDGEGPASDEETGVDDTENPLQIDQEDEDKVFGYSFSAYRLSVLETGLLLTHYS